MHASAGRASISDTGAPAICQRATTAARKPVPKRSSTVRSRCATPARRPWAATAMRACSAVSGLSDMTCSRLNRPLSGPVEPRRANPASRPCGCGASSRRSGRTPVHRVRAGLSVPRHVADCPGNGQRRRWQGDPYRSADDDNPRTAATDESCTNHSTRSGHALRCDGHDRTHCRPRARRHDRRDHRRDGCSTHRLLYQPFTAWRTAASTCRRLAGTFDDPADGGWRLSGSTRIVQTIAARWRLSPAFSTCPARQSAVSPVDVHHLRLPDRTPVGSQRGRLRGRLLLRLVLRSTASGRTRRTRASSTVQHGGVDTFEPDERAAEQRSRLAEGPLHLHRAAGTRAASRSTTSGSTRACAPR